MTGLLADPAVLAILAGLAGLGLYLVTCVLWPWARCLRCRRTPGRRRAMFGSSWGPCRWCGGRGRRVRVGRHLLDRLRSDP